MQVLEAQSYYTPTQARLRRGEERWDNEYTAILVSSDAELVRTA